MRISGRSRLMCDADWFKSHRTAFIFAVYICKINLRNVSEYDFGLRIQQAQQSSGNMFPLLKPANPGHSICRSMFSVMFPSMTEKSYFWTSSFCSKMFPLTSVFWVRVDAPVGVQHVSEEVAFVKSCKYLQQSTNIFIIRETVISCKDIS